MAVAPAPRTHHQRTQTLWGLPLLTRVYGSALPRAFAPALVAGVITGALAVVSPGIEGAWAHPYAFNALVLLVSFALTFRCVCWCWLSAAAMGWCSV
jgi:hypothetical protein